MLPEFPLLKERARERSLQSLGLKKVARPILRGSGYDNTTINNAINYNSLLIHHSLQNPHTLNYLSGSYSPALYI